MEAEEDDQPSDPKVDKAGSPAFLGLPTLVPNVTTFGQNLALMDGPNLPKKPYQKAFLTNRRKAAMIIWALENCKGMNLTKMSVKVSEHFNEPISRQTWTNWFVKNAHDILMRVEEEQLTMSPVPTKKCRKGNVSLAFRTFSNKN